jgi:hypothetical protein
VCVCQASNEALLNVLLNDTANVAMLCKKLPFAVDELLILEVTALRLGRASRQIEHDISLPQQAAIEFVQMQTNPPSLFVGIGGWNDIAMLQIACS